jgi:hypothetical protein
MGYDIRVYSLLEIVHKNNSVAYIELASKGRYTLGAEYDEPWDAEPRTKQQKQEFEDTFLEVDFLDSDSYQDYPILLYSQREDTLYNKNNFLFPDTHYERYNSLLDEKTEDGCYYRNENDLDYTDDDKRYGIIEKGELLLSKDDIITIHKVLQKKWIS